MRIEYLGQERITVGAGSFDAWHFCYGDSTSDAKGSNETGEHPPYQVWTTADSDFIMLKASVAGYMMTHYELMSLERLPSD